MMKRSWGRAVALATLASFVAVSLAGGRVFAGQSAANHEGGDPPLRRDGPAAAPADQPTANEDRLPGRFEKQAPGAPSGNRRQGRWLPCLLVGSAAVTLGLLVLFAAKKKGGAAVGAGVTPTWKDIEWVPIPAGEFAMGDNFGDGNVNERPVHRVYLDGYAIARHEVTFDQFDTFCLDTGRRILPDQGWGRGLRPAINVKYKDAFAFCAWLSRRIGRNVHLPTEAQWEKAARGMTQTRYPWGNAAPDCSMACFQDCRGGRTDPVGSFPGGSSPYGALDMAGSVWEWVADYHSQTYYQECANQGLVRNPPGPPQGTRNGADTFRVLRGGDYGSPAFFIRATVRIAHINGQGVMPGFRPCVD